MRRFGRWGFGTWRAYAADSRGNLLVVTALAALSVATASFATDFMRKGSAESELQKIADAAVAAAVNPADLPADEAAALSRRRDIIENYVRNSKRDLTDATMLGSPRIEIDAHGAKVTLQASFEGTWTILMASVGMTTRPKPNMAVMAEANW